MSSSTLTPKQLEVIGKMTVSRGALAALNDPMQDSTPENVAAAAKVFRDVADLLDEVAACLTGEGSEAFKEALTNV